MREKIRSKNMDTAALTKFTEYLCLKTLGQHPNEWIIQPYPNYVKLLWGSWAFYARAALFLIFLTELLAADTIGKNYVQRICEVSDAELQHTHALVETQNSRC